MVIAIDKFFGCYLLYSLNPKYKGRTYIGYTVNPERRIHQHNAGKQKGGAWKTSGKGPWEMVLIIHGFPSDIAALRFEWAWQNPVRSRRLKHVTGKSRKESHFQYRVRVVSNMLCQSPWKKLPLTVRWLKQEYAFDLEPIPPTHMPIAFGPVTAKVKKHKVITDCASQVNSIFDSLKTTPCSSASENIFSDVERTEDVDDDNEKYESLFDRLTAANVQAKEKNKETPISSADAACFLCKSPITNEKSLACLNESCKMTSHLTCLAQHFLAADGSFQLLPIEGVCPSCNSFLLWGELIRISQGFHQYLKSN